MTSMHKNTEYIALGGLFIAVCFVGGFLLMGRHHDEDAPGPTLPGLEVPAKPVAVGVRKEVYRADFTEVPGEEWNVKKVSQTKAGGRPNLGPFFPKDSPTLTLKDLPVHQMLRATFDLYLTDSWDGSSPGWGPSLFEVTLDDDRSLIHTTFGNCGFFSDNNEQAFPDNYPAMVYRAFTMAAEKQTLGAKHDFGGGPSRIIDCSSVYHLEFTFPHDQPQVVFHFQTSIKDGDYKGYGIANMRVEVLPQVAVLTAEQMAKCWADLGSGEPEVFFKARWDLISAGDGAVEFISKHRDDKIEMSDAEMQRLAALMKDSDPDKARAAYYQLRVMGPDALAVMAPVIAGGDSFLKLLSSQFQRYPLPATENRLERAKAVLDAIHTEAARRLKQALE